jgi:hypothetical protein
VEVQVLGKSESDVMLSGEEERAFSKEGRKCSRVSLPDRVPSRLVASSIHEGNDLILLLRLDGRGRDGVDRLKEVYLHFLEFRHYGQE